MWKESVYSLSWPFGDLGPKLWDCQAGRTNGDSSGFRGGMATG